MWKPRKGSEQYEKKMIEGIGEKNRKRRKQDKGVELRLHWKGWRKHGKTWRKYGKRRSITRWRITKQR